jgi:hypothetical protein
MDFKLLQTNSAPLKVETVTAFTVCLAAFSLGSNRKDIQKYTELNCNGDFKLWKLG